MWICDAGQLYDSISDNWCGIGIADVSEILEFVKYAPTIDPETLPIVRQLREELARVTEERDTAIQDRAKLADYELSVCEGFCFGDAPHSISMCEWLVYGKCKLREWRGQKKEK